MIICIAGLLNDAELGAVRETLAELPFRDGRVTAGWQAREVKHNLQADPSDAAALGLTRMLRERLLANELFQIAVRPKRLSSLILSRYEPGMAYGTHVDDALMHGLRSDVSFTLFLSPAEAYDGGELVIEDAAGERAFKLPAGSAVVYPSTSLHRVEQVRRGERLAAVGWARSQLRDPGARELLFDLEQVRARLAARADDPESLGLVSKSIANLLRRWVED
ncbi:MAG: Fe2+-dependent dioxygenase [Gammaproteobacteria bacterium]|nr:Fe2+-dependent dioxygenase [Gammaproteobacteria bacterium]